MVPDADSQASSNTFKLNVKDSANTYHPYWFTKTDTLYSEGRYVYKTVIENPTYTDVIKVQFQTYDSTQQTWIGQVVDEQSVELSFYDGKYMVCTSATAGTLQ